MAATRSIPNRFGIPRTYQIQEGDHGNRITNGSNGVAPFFSRHLAFDPARQRSSAWLSPEASRGIWTDES
jgi:hypothetical protein